MEKTESFLRDFGLLLTRREQDVLYMRGAAAGPAYCYRLQQGPKARFLGLGFEVSSRAELEALAALAGASTIEASAHPGGGQQVSLRDPSGFLVEVLWNQKRVPALPCRKPLPVNSSAQQPRVNEPQRPPLRPTEVLRLGHAVLEVADFQATCSWYTQHLGLIPSDVQVLPDGSPGVVFLRLDRGPEPTDHHTLAIAQGFMPLYSHSAYEVVDLDAITMGHRFLKSRRWTHAWGVGRHILGSQLFDYWQDPCGDKHEHYCDGDVFTSDHPLGVHPIHREAMAQWGPPMPASFTRPSFTAEKLQALFKNVRTSPDLSFRKLTTLARLLG